MKTFKHRSWNHICWTFESGSGLNKMYLNGELQGSFTIKSDFTKMGILGSDEVLDFALIIGQEPDAPSPRGGFEAEQVFVGDITELNMWNFTLDEMNIKSKATCKNFEKGNIVSWDLNNFIVNNVQIEEIGSSEDLCESVDQLLVFPKKMSWSAAWTLCTAHGGLIYTPQSEEDNVRLLSTMDPYQDQCADPVSGNLAWLGIKSKDYNWYKIGQKKALSVQKFTNWEAATAPYFDSYECGFVGFDGTWASDLNCNSKVKLCTVCQLTGKCGISL